MWQYNYTDELKHYGVVGMKWGHRKRQTFIPDSRLSNTRNKYDSTKFNYKNAKQDYNKSFKKAYRYSQTHPVSQFYGKNKTKTETNWNDASKKATTYDKAKSDYKAAKKDRNQQIKSAKANIKNNDLRTITPGAKKLAAKFVVDQNMPVNKAVKTANKLAVQKAVSMLEISGALAITALTIKNSL